MIAILQRDAVWASGWHPHSYVLNNHWVRNVKAHGISKSVVKYFAVDTEQRSQAQAAWNAPVLWPIFVVVGILLVALLPGYRGFRRRQQRRIQTALTNTTPAEKEG